MYADGSKQVKGVDAEAVYLAYISRKYPVYLPYISQVKGVDAEPVAATTRRARRRACGRSTLSLTLPINNPAFTCVPGNLAQCKRTSQVIWSTALQLQVT